MPSDLLGGRRPPGLGEQLVVDLLDAEGEFLEAARNARPAMVAEVALEAAGDARHREGRERRPERRVKGVDQTALAPTPKRACTAAPTKRLPIVPRGRELRARRDARLSKEQRAFRPVSGAGRCSASSVLRGCGARSQAWAWQ